ncbi:MAG: hypothetical protein CVU91_10900 [Firmicutes bacterium HGW-Firmicutes-16]|nr:MAG: hypothetical protein CVU91_10900 [Firmicutes bacterium HGW-Firmicutes-16]
MWNKNWQKIKIFRSKAFKVILLIVLIVISLIFTSVPIIAYFGYNNTPSIFAIFVVICYDTFTVWFGIHNFRNKKS